MSPDIKSENTRLGTAVKLMVVVESSIRMTSIETVTTLHTRRTRNSPTVGSPLAIESSWRDDNLLRQGYKD